MSEDREQRDRKDQEVVVDVVEDLPLVEDAPTKKPSLKCVRKEELTEEEEIW